MKEVKIINFSANNEDTQTFKSIVENSAKVAAASAYKNFGKNGLIEEVKVEDYKVQDIDVRKTAMAFAAQKAGLEVPQNETDLQFAMDNPVFKSVMNSIVSKTIATMMANYRSPLLESLVDVQRVGVGGSLSVYIKSKALPIVQRGSYNSNVASVYQESVSSVVVKPKPHTLGKSIYYINLLKDEYDWSFDVAKIYAAMMFAKYRLAVNKMFDTANITSTPFNQVNFTSDAFVQLASDVEMFAGENVVAYGTKPAFNKVNTLASVGGFAVVDERIREGYLNRMLGVDAMALAQITDASAPFTAESAASLRVIPNDKILLIPSNTKPCVLVEEDYICAEEVDANRNSINRMEYIFTQSFDAVRASGNPYGIIGTTNA